MGKYNPRDLKSSTLIVSKDEQIVSLSNRLRMSNDLWQIAEGKLQKYAAQLIVKNDALRLIIARCQHIKDNPNVAGILKIAEQAMEDNSQTSTTSTDGK